MELLKKYVDLDDKTYRVRVYYNKGGINYFTYKTDARGYYLSVTPVVLERRGNGITIESCTIFSGIKALLLGVQRRSKKSDDSALSMASESRINDLINHVKNGNQ